MADNSPRKIGSIGLQVRSVIATPLTLSGSDNWLEYDALHFDLDAIIASYEIPAKSAYTTAELVAMQSFQRLANERLTELLLFLRSGRTVFVSPGILPTFPYDEKGNGKRSPAFQKYPWEAINARKMIGNTGGDLANSSIGDVYKDLLNLFGHEYTFSPTLGQPIAFAAGTQEPIACIQSIEGGKVIYLPRPKLTNDKQRNEIAFGLFYGFLVDILTNKLTAEPAGEIPAWTSTYSWPELDGEYQTEAALNAQIAGLEIKRSNSRSKITNEEKLRNLLAGTGSALESATKAALAELGVRIDSDVGNQSDVIGYFEDQLLVFEVKGVSGSATLKHCRQLLHWMDATEERLDAISKGILVIVPYRDVPIENRVNPVFPPNVIEFAEKKRLCLVTGDQLLTVCLDARHNPTFSADFLRTMIDTEGVLQIGDSIGRYKST